MQTLFGIEDAITVPLSVFKYNSRKARQFIRPDLLFDIGPRSGLNMVAEILIKRRPKLINERQS